MAVTLADVKEYPNSYVFIVDMPGLKSSNISVKIEDGSMLVSRGKSKPPGACWTCGKKGHFRRDCNSSSSKKIDDEEKDTMSLTEEVSSDEALLLSCDDVN
ncbi:hypothetical protein GIB67_023346 [Kingdonia uniflora]|uniref:CCHC-type domain-containing protein n=1 Tax=Kingdonia uniflora TaxID=39325 RepID=A0A7J7LI25_9MAGN|nr:hypothetical protein GIB67_023346 [Kingdonia uniflora]